MICISCPVGCDMIIKDGTVIGNECAAGEKYAHMEANSPMRHVTTSIRVGRQMLSVKTSAPIPKSMIFTVINSIHACTVDAPVSIGDVILPNVCGLDVDILASRNIEVIK